MLALTQSLYGIGSGAGSLDSPTIKTPTLQVSSTGSLVLVQNPSQPDIFSISQDWGKGPDSGPEFSGQPTSSYFSVATSFGVPVFEAFDDSTFSLGKINKKTNTIDREGHVYFSGSYLQNTEKLFTDPI